MIDPDAPETANPNAAAIVSTSIRKDAQRAPLNALGDDDQRWLETVLQSLPGRSEEAKQALAKALENGQNNTDPLGCAISKFPLQISPNTLNGKDISGVRKPLSRSYASWSANASFSTV